MAGTDKYSEMVSAYLDGELTNDEILEFEQHLKTCEECRHILAMYTAMSGALNDLDESPGADFSTNVMSLIQNENSPRPIKSKKNSIIKWFAATAAVLVVIAGVLFLPMSRNSESETSLQESVMESAESEDTLDPTDTYTLPEKRSTSSSDEAQNDNSSSSIESLPEDYFRTSDPSQAELQESIDDSVELFSGIISEGKVSVIVPRDNISILFSLSAQSAKMPEGEPTVTVRINTENGIEDYPVWIQEDAVIILYTDGQTYISDISPNTMSQIISDTGILE